MERHVYVVTHGAKFSGPNPGMTDKGKEQVRSLRPLLPGVITEVVVGGGLRHHQMPPELGLTPTRWTSAVGTPDSGEASVPGREVDMVRIADGTPEGLLVEYSRYTTLQDCACAAQAVAVSLKHNSVICAGRPSMIMFGMSEDKAKSAAVYRLTIVGKTIQEIDEITALGVSETHAV